MKIRSAISCCLFLCLFTNTDTSSGIFIQPVVYGMHGHSFASYGRCLDFPILIIDTLPEFDTIQTLKELRFSLDVFQIDIVDPSSGIQFYKSGILYLQDSKEAAKDIRVNFGTLDTYCAAIDGNSPRAPDFFSKQFAFPFPSEATSFTSDYSDMYFTKKSRFKGSDNDIIKIYHSQYVKSDSKKKTGWSENVQELPFNGDHYSCTQPSVSPDGNILVFASDMPGGKGKLDLYVVYNNNGTWSDLQNLGDAINTAEDENFPFLLNSTTLFFSTQGLKGYGGYDIYVTKFDGHEWTQTSNLGSSINSDMDEIAFTMNRTNQELAFFSSNRNLFKKEMQVFKATLESGKSLFDENKVFTGADLAFLTVPRELSEITESIAVIPAPSDDAESVDTKEKVVIPVTMDATPEPVKTEVSTETIPEPDQTGPADFFDFRVQFKASSKPLGTFDVTVDGVTYTTHEYFYKGAYRYTIGKFSATRTAYELQKKCRQAGYRDAFVVTFKNNERTLETIHEDMISESLTPEPSPGKKVTIEPEPEPQLQEPQEIIDFRIQFKASAKSLGKFEVTIGGVTYKAEEYFYKGAYRYTIGKFNTPRAAYDLQKKCRQAGYSDAFVAAFKNNQRTSDMNVFDKFR